MPRRMTADRRRRGLDFRFDAHARATRSTRTGSCTWPADHGLQDAMKERLLRAYLTEGELI